jgi:tetratricopeptide (TPR) repeat protein
LSTSTKPRTRKQVTEDARAAALEGRWNDAIAINRELIQRDSKDTEAHNRMGRALMELRDYSAAYEAYSNALKSDPANLIARRNLRRLELLRQHRADAAEGAPGTVFPRTAVFIEEVGKTWVTELTNPVATSTLAGIFAGQELELTVDGERLYVTDRMVRSLARSSAAPPSE